MEKRQENDNSAVTWYFVLRSVAFRGLPETEIGRLREWLERRKASIRVNVERPFHVVKDVF